MYHIAIVEDEKEFSKQLVEYLEQYEKENDVKIKVSVFNDGKSILAGYTSHYTVIQ